MNIFILNTGRCGSTTIIRACEHITNYSASHESRSGMPGEDRFRYPPDHIEADNRLSWFLGRLDKVYGDDAFYVHLQRNEAATVRSFVDRYRAGIMRAYREHILLGCRADSDPPVVCQDYVDTVTCNITHFLKDKSKWMNFSLDNAKQDFPVFWDRIGAEGDLRGALSEFDVAYNATVRRKRSVPERLVHKAQRVLHEFPRFIKYV